MDTTFAIVIICFFVICACFITWAALGGPKRNLACKLMTLAYIALSWMCVITLVILVFIYHLT